MRAALKEFFKLIRDDAKIDNDKISKISWSKDEYFLNTKITVTTTYASGEIVVDDLDYDKQRKILSLL